MVAWLKTPDVREVEILSDKKTLFLLRSLPEPIIRRASQILIESCIRVVTEPTQLSSQACRQIFVQFDSHA